MNSGPDSCTGIGVVVRSFAILLIPEQLRQKHEQASPESPIIANNTRSYGNGETRNHLIGNAIFPLDPRTDLAGRPWQRFGDPEFQFVLLLHGQPATAAFMVEAHQPLNPVFLI